MTEQTPEQILEWARKPDEINSPQTCDQLLFWASCWKMDFENELATVDHQVSVRKHELMLEHGTVSKAQVYLEIEPIYKRQQDLELRINQLKELKGNVRRRYEILTEKLLRKY